MQYGSLSSGITRFSINRGRVDVVSTQENFRVKAPDGANITFMEAGDALTVDVPETAQSAKIFVNVNQLPKCSVALDAGNLSVFSLCKHGTFSVGSGNLVAHLARGSVGKVTGNVDVGTLVNKSPLTADSNSSSTPNAGFQGEGFFGRFVSSIIGSQTSSGMDLKISLSGDLSAQGHVSDFAVDAGNLVFEK